MKANIKTKARLFAVSLLAIATTSFAAAPPNTLDMGSVANTNTQYTPQLPYSPMVQSPVLNQAPMDVQPYITPSTKTFVANEVKDYLDSQLSPYQMQQLKTQRLEKDRIAATPYDKLPNPVVRSLAVDLSPGKTPPIIRVAKNMLTSIVFTDIDGNPWYIERVSLNRNQFTDNSSQSSIAAAQANARSLQNATDATTGTDLANQGNRNNNVADPNDPTTQNNASNNQQSQDPTANLTNILTLEPIQAIDYGNVSVTLRGKSIPVIFMVAAGQNEVDIRVDAKISGKNPDVEYKINSPLNSVSKNRFVDTPDIDAVNLAFLDGNVPEDAIPLISSDASVQAWVYDDKLYVKTRFDVLYPNFMRRAASADGTKIYRFDGDVNDITFVQRYGQPVTVSFEQNTQPYYER